MKRLLLSILLSLPALAANHYILDGGSGDGSSWSSAWDDLPATLTRGDTYYIGDGNYASYTFNDAASGSTLITVKKATAADHGTDTGWSSAYGDGMAVFNDSLHFDTSNWLFDGQVGGGPGAWNSGFGFRVEHTNDPPTSAKKLLHFYYTSYSTNVTVSHVQFEYTTISEGTTVTDLDTVYIYGCDYITVDHCAFLYAGRVHVFLEDANHITFDSCYHYWCRCCESQHSESWATEDSDFITIKNCLFHENTGTGQIVNLNRITGAQTSDDWEIYGCVFWDTGARSRYSASDSPIVNINGEEASRWKIYNNCFIGMEPMNSGGNVGIDLSQGTTTSGGNEVYNNLWYDGRGQIEQANISFVSGDTTSVHDYNYFINITTMPTEDHRQTGSADPFVDYSNFVFALTNATDGGYSLGSPYNVDPVGSTRGADGTFDRGAYEFGGTLHYILDGGSGDGSSWSSALDDLPAALARGDTYYIGDGNYAAYTFDDAASGTELITVRKATVDSHGTETGWLSAYGDGQAVFNSRLLFSTSYHLVDGQVGGGAGSWTNGFGFKVQHTNDPPTASTKLIRFSASYNTVSHLEGWFTTTSGGTEVTDLDCIYTLTGSNNTVDHCAFYYSGRDMILTANVSYFTVTDSYFFMNRLCDSQHAQLYEDQGSDYVVFANNLVSDCTGTGLLVVLSRGGTAASDNWEIYGNVFYDSRQRVRYSASDSPIVVINGEYANGWKIYNNCFVNLQPNGTGGNVGIDFSQGETTTGGHEVYNNLWYDDQGATETVDLSWASGDATSVHGYNYVNGMASSFSEATKQTATGDPFTAYAALDFSLSSATDAGYSLGAPYNTDPLGNTRGADGTWDRGAIEFDADEEPPEPPTGLRIMNAGTVNAGTIRRL